jgi:hypothetical protein
MKASGTLCFAIFMAIATVANAAQPRGVDMGACHYTPDALQSWKDLWTRQLGVLDPQHAAQLSKVASEIIDGRTDAVKAEIAGGLSPNATLKGAGGDMSLLALAVAACQDKVARELVLLGAAADGDAASAPLVLAVAKGQGDLAEFLIQHGAMVEKVDVNGHTALEEAVRQHQLPAVQVLLKHGSNPNRILSRNATVLDFVAKSSDPDDQAIAKELRAHGAASGLAVERPGLPQ